VSSIVRGIGLLAMCGNQSPAITPDSTDFDAPKMTIIQMNDVPLIETIRPNGFTQFSLSFRCVNPTKLSLYEKNETIPVETNAETRKRRYKAISMTAVEGDPVTTDYGDVTAVESLSGATRKYGELREVNFDSLIHGEEMTEPSYDATAYETVANDQTIVLHNAGNYFAFPIFVFPAIGGVTPVGGGPPTAGATKDTPVTLRNLTTQEVMKIQRNVELNRELVIDTGLRRVGQVNPVTTAVSWAWDDRNALSLDSQWISLAPGDNTILMSAPASVSVPTLPTVHWRDTWIG
jgi:Siphovirus-type tail component, C-terminal domain